MERRTNQIGYASLDFETYSEAGYQFHNGRWINKGGISRAGAWKYSRHPSTEILSAAYEIPDNQGPRVWVPEMINPPENLIAWIASGGLIGAFNAFFEFCIWVNCTTWGPLPVTRFIDSQAAALAFGLDKSLDSVGQFLGIKNLKIKDGKRLIKKFCIPRQPTKKDIRLRIRPLDDPIDAGNLYTYNIGDITAEKEIASILPPLSNLEQQIYHAHLAINARGVAIDMEGLHRCMGVIDRATETAHNELFQLTSGACNTAAELQKMQGWLAAQGCRLPNMQAATIEAAVKRPDLTPAARRALEIRQITSLISVKKLYAIADMLADDNRLHGLFIYCGANRTGRFTGAGPQPHNIPAGGPECYRCNICGRHGPSIVCIYCETTPTQPIKWNPQAAVEALTDPEVYPNRFAAVSGCLRSLFVSAPGCDLVASDYSSIEAVVLAVMAGEQWRIDAFKRGEDIYVLSAEQIGMPGNRKAGKVAELASGYQGSIGAWRQFGATGADEEILAMVRSWRRSNPNIVRYWYAIEDCFKAALKQPGRPQACRSISMEYNGRYVAIRLPSGRLLYYHDPMVVGDQIIFSGEETYGGKLVENITQATARDILAYALVNCESAGYPVVLHVHDEIVCELSEGRGSVAELEKIMEILPPWAADWPIKASGGYRAKRYRK